MARRAIGHRYGRGHKALRRHFLLRMQRGEVFNCWRCGGLIDPRGRWDLGHVGDNTAVGGQRWPEHTWCNRATVTNLKQKLDEHARRSRDW